MDRAEKERRPPPPHNEEGIELQRNMSNAIRKGKTFNQERINPRPILAQTFPSTLIKKGIQSPINELPHSKSLSIES
jgi:hypothetical protein